MDNFYRLDFNETDSDCNKGYFEKVEIFGYEYENFKKYEDFYFEFHTMLTQLAAHVYENDPEAVEKWRTLYREANEKEGD